MSDKTGCIVVLREDTTIRWSCRTGDFVLWVRLKNFLTASFGIADVWEMKDGDFVTITNRKSDLPAWFELQPDEVTGMAVYEMAKKLKSGFRPSGKCEGPNLWRACSGDKVVLVGSQRQPHHPTDEALTILDVQENALVYADSNRPDFTPLDLIDLSETSDSLETKRRWRIGFEHACKLGMPRTFADEWRLG